VNLKAHPTLHIIGLTGNIATGKSVVAAMLADLGARVIDADVLAHEVMRSGTETCEQVVEEFGSHFLQPDGEVNRLKLGAHVFADPDALARLEDIVHPAVIAESERLLQQAGREAASPPTGSAGQQVVALEAIKLIESGMHQRCDELWVVTCPRDQQVQRLVETRGWSVEEAELRVDAQPAQQEKVALADVVVDNSGSLEQTRAQVLRHWQRVLDRVGQSDIRPQETASGGNMPSWRQFIDDHPLLAMWAVLAVGMVLIFLVTSRDVELLPSQRLFMALACVATAGLCTWIISWE
jgi:dephospho-CoA kinase